ncbi:phosphatase PAP2 family protein [Micrococcus endophyticus]|nr:phosphatase PAP2 family protein [Micrococcus endophyticus]MCK6091586.1 phosphatase PAP2 family protein [Micrococcus endophyticus]
MRGPVRRRWLAVVAVAAALYAVVMGLSRVYLGAHWLSDVMAGWTVGLAWALAVVLDHRVWLTLRRR